MPEYLAPGVYVEETSFRAKSIEGVGTSTTAFAGPTRRGPVKGTPEMITSFGDFERIYGGFDDLSFNGVPVGDRRRINYLAHGVRNYFDNGGARLYVSRVYTPFGPDPGTAESAPLVSAGADREAKFVSRFPGAAGNGKITVRLLPALATQKSLDGAMPGTVLRVGGETVAVAGKLTGVAGPYKLEDGGKLEVKSGPTTLTVTFSGAAAEVVGDAVLGATVDLSAPADAEAEVTLNEGPAFKVALPTANNVPIAEVLNALNKALRGGYAGLDATQHLIIGSDRQGKTSSVTVKHDKLGFALPAGKTAAGTGNVDDLAAVKGSEIVTLLTAQGDAAAASVSPAGELVLTSKSKGNAAKLEVLNNAGSVRTALGFPGGEVSGTDAVPFNYYVKTGDNFTDASDAVLALGGIGAGAQTVTVTVIAEDADGHISFYEELGLHKSHPRFIGSVLAVDPPRRADQLESLFALQSGSAVTAFDLLNGMFEPGSDSKTFTLQNGDDGGEPDEEDYRAALEEIESLEDVAIVAAPGHSAYSTYPGVQSQLVGHAERTKAYRIAVLDSGPDLKPSGVQAERARIDSKYAAMYYPWVRVTNPLSRPGVMNVPEEVVVPPSGFICGIYARNDIERGVFKAPANEIVRNALRFEDDINFAEQSKLNPLGINCLRYFPGRGYRVWGARTVSSDPEWKYVNVRRYFLYLENSIDRGTQWAVFEPNGERLWANITETIDSFLYNEWRNGALLGSSPKESYFVRCDRSTMTQADLDNGRLICLIGVAVLKPAEFVVFRIGQKTADARS